MPDSAEYRDLTGMTLAQALAALRAETWGDLGGMSSTELSDGSMLSVELHGAVGGGQLTGTQHARRIEFDRGLPHVVRSYKI